MTDTQDLRPPCGSTRTEIIDGLRAGLEEEIDAVVQDLKRWGGDVPVEVKGGEYHGEEDQHSYRILLPRPLYPPEHTGVMLESGKTRIRGWVEEVEEDGRALWLALEERLREEFSDHRLSFDPTFVIRSTLELLQNVVHDDFVGRAMVDRLMGVAPVQCKMGPSLPADLARKLNRDQRRLVRTMEASNLVVGFGPPGTGKTETGGKAIAHLAKQRGLKVLVTAHTNAALDTIMAAVVENLPGWADEGKIVRSGRLSPGFQHLGIGFQDFLDRMLREHSSRFGEALTEMERRADSVLPVMASKASLDPILALSRARRKQKSRAKKRGGSRAASGFRGRITALQARLDQAAEDQSPDRKMVRLAEDLETLSEELRKGIGHPEKSAQVVGATFSKLAVEPDAFGRYDVAVADEASMAMLAQVMIAGSFADRTFVALGDGRQLPPIVQSRGKKAKQWLKRNLYQHLGLEDPSVEDPRSVLLRTQYRMAPPIRTIVSDMFYAGLLEDAPELKGRSGRTEVKLIDTSEYGWYEEGPGGQPEFRPNVSEPSGRSRHNPAHADLIARMVEELHREGERDIAIITPFNAQAKLIRNALRAHHLSAPFWRGGGTVSTIHRAQGGERDIVLLDLVDAPQPGGGTRGMSRFLDASWNSDLPHLLNVAISRARRRLLVVAHAPGFRARYGPGAMIFELLRRLYNAGDYERPQPPTP